MTKNNVSKKDEILNAAIILFAEQGFSNTSITEVAKATNASTANIFYHFKNKEELFLAALENVKQGIITRFDEYFRDRDFTNGLQMMEEIISYYLYLAGSMEQWFLLLHSHYPYRLALVNNVCRDHLEQTYNSLVEIFEQAVVRGKKDGSIADVDSRKTALVIFSMVEGVVRFKIYNLYDAGALFNELIKSCNKILKYKE
ncbi:MAG: TetR/AcrR family transcriptional regulator [Desulfamplus sp.]|nr:TetR/AcrR family transcriptional regulator [Desulfamplus sp.]MBF0411947.1 TetR/AcrR family transcriptional regulator [Desulfamplus sp.]